ncbi:aquaporin [Sinomonas sp. R1AF57]|uniref:aquaporin n=1 Tax=Sinomonas sp. R1AF57 TaxID=2020377 RepID=UPI000B5F81F8|nr:aquaporin [Sinomonas sp. R1AF57]ASN52268.1 porin [Sinomonas sp. R1AF57]
MTTSVATPAAAKAPAEYGAVAKLVAEAFGTFLLIFGALGVALFGNPSAAPLPTSLAFGLSFAVGIAAVGHISGGHFNPAVTVGLAVAGRTNWRLVPGYIAAQLVGGALGSLVLWVLVRTLPNLTNVSTIFTQLSNGVDDHSPNAFPLAAGLLAEVTASAVFVAIVLFATSRRAAKGMAPWAIGFGLAILIQALAPITNASLNPARSTATVIFADASAIGQLWIFWAAPILGAALTGLIFRGFGSSEDLHGATAGALDDATARATRADHAAVAGAAIADTEAAEAEAGDEATDAPAAARSAGDVPAGSATAEARPQPSGSGTAGPAEGASSPDDDARDFFDKNR